MGFLWAVILILFVIVLILLFKIHLLRKAASEIEEAFADRLAGDTNTLIDISSRDPCMRKLAASINEQLRLLRQQRQQYLGGDRELKEAVTNMSHDLRTPLTAICGYLDLLEREEKSENVSRYLSHIKNRTQALRQLTEELFRYSVILGEEELTLEELAVNAVLEESIAGFYGALTEKGIIPEIHMTQTPVFRRLNRKALSRVFSNILSNALKYSDGDLRITLLDSGEILFANHAANVDQVQVGRLFDRFFSVESAGNSTGLGLAIAKTLVERMGGSIFAQISNGLLSIHILFPATKD
ncbi:MAG: sensor histidine kinase [Negativibacillus sp.]